MGNEEDYLKRVARVLITADGGCSNCVNGIAKSWLNEFPETPPIDLVNALKAALEEDEFSYPRIDEKYLLEREIDE